MATIPETDWRDFYPAGIEPAWEVALFYPAQGSWSIGDYLELSERNNQLVEFTSGKIEVLTMPNIEHQRLVFLLITALQAFVDRTAGGLALMAPHPTTITSDKIREPDIVFKLPENVPDPGANYFEGADLVMEVVSPDKKSHERDYHTKRADYAEGGISEYWIVDPQQKLITVLKLQDKSYVEHGVFREGQTATSQLLDGFTVDVSAVFAAAKA